MEHESDAERPLPDIGEHLKVDVEIDAEKGTYPPTIVGAKVVDVKDGYYDLWYYNADGEVVDSRSIGKGRVTANLDHNDGKWGIFASPRAAERPEVPDICRRDETIDYDVDDILDDIEEHADQF